MTTTKIASLAFLAASSGLAQSASAVGTLHGSVTDPQGQPLVGAQVTYRQLVPVLSSSWKQAPVPSGPVAQGQVTADASGEYSVAGLPSGEYVLCAEESSMPYLDPCTWQQPLHVTILTGGSTIQTVILTKGVFLRARVSDPVGLLPNTVDDVWTPSKLLVGVKYAGGAYQGAPNTGVDAGGHDYQLVIPVSEPVTLWLFSRDVGLSDASGNAVDISGSQIPFQAAPGQDQVFTFTVTGPATQMP